MVPLSFSGLSRAGLQALGPNLQMWPYGVIHLLPIFCFSSSFSRSPPQTQRAVMDVLLGSIDVRELLSTTDIDESSPLSVPDLRLLIDRLQIRSLDIKQKVQSYITSHHQDFSETFSHCSNISSKTESISTDLTNLLSLISDHPIDIEIRDTTAEISKKRRELKEKKELLVLVQTIVNLVERLRLVKDDFNNGRLIQAAESLRDLKIALLIRDGDDIDENHGHEPRVFGLLRNEWKRCFNELQEVFSRVMEEAVKFETGRVRVKFRLSVGEVDEKVELGNVLTAMEVIGLLDYGLAKVADLFVKFVVIPTISNGSRFDFVEETNRNSSEMDEAVLGSISSSDSEIEIPSIYSRIIQVIKFVYNFFCQKKVQCMRCFGRLSWPQISELIIAHFLAKAVPNDASKLSDFQKIIELTSEFETALKEMKFLSQTDDKDRRLSGYAQNVEFHFASRKKIEILAKARSVLLQCDFSFPAECTRKSHPYEVHGGADDFSEQDVELLFLLDRCIISRAGTQIMELVHLTLRDVCLSTARVSTEFYHAARDALLLYEAIIPVKLEKQLNSINEVAILVHNDCLYFSQELLGLLFQYRSEFPSSLKEHAIFVDMAPRFRQMAEKVLKRQIQLVDRNLKEALDGAGGFQNTHQMQQYESAKLSIDQVIFIIEKVRIIWEPLLLPCTYKRSMCTILDSVFSRLVEDVLLLDDMAAEETLQLQRLIQILLDSIYTLLNSLDAIHENVKFQDDAKHIPLNELMPSLPKLRKLADLLDMPLKSITNAWESGELDRNGYTSSEVENFVKSIFTDSPLRKECLWRIKSLNL